MASKPSAEKWQVRMLRPGLPGIERLPNMIGLSWLAQPVRPPEVSNGLRDVMLTRDNMLEDVNYQKVVPNRYIVEVSQGNYQRHFRPIEAQILRQWQERLLEELITANSRRGRKEFRLGGRLLLELRPDSNLKDNEVRILSRIEPEAAPPQAKVAAPPSARPRVAAPKSPSKPSPLLPRQSGGQQRGTQQPGGSVAYLELVPTGQRWALYPGVNTIGRSEMSQIYLSNPVVQEKRLVSGLHAFILMENGECILHDGSPDGRPSSNGTYVNLRRVPPGGYRLQNGDAIVLAAVDPLYPRSDTPGVVTFYFWASRSS
jgi:hypothetical protein